MSYLAQSSLRGSKLKQKSLIQRTTYHAPSRAKIPADNVLSRRGPSRGDLSKIHIEGGWNFGDFLSYIYEVWCLCDFSRLALEEMSNTRQEV